MNIIDIELDKPNNTYSTSDIAIAAVLYLYYPILEVDKSNMKKVIFTFKKDRNFDLLIERYWRDELKVNARKYFGSLRSLKSIIYNQ